MEKEAEIRVSPLCSSLVLKRHSMSQLDFKKEKEAVRGSKCYQRTAGDGC